MTIITTQRLIIRHFKEEDAAALFDYLSSPRTPCFKDEKLHSLAEAEVDVAKRASDPTQFAVCLNETDTLIGHLFADNSNEPDSNTWSEAGILINVLNIRDMQASQLLHCLIIYLK